MWGSMECVWKVNIDTCWDRFNPEAGSLADNIISVRILGGAEFTQMAETEFFVFFFKQASEDWHLEGQEIEQV